MPDAPEYHDCEGCAVSFDDRPLSEVIKSVEREYICTVLNKTDGNKAEAARIAGLTYQTFLRKLAALNLKVTYHAE